eukprot:TRINITY_DN6804_c1_g1_i3.p1 TRINITY_DN6804_c1_g1~~TRINITY_DN6804_c1_g1_i3.p1  ORF type:complete len:127 (+),score=12.80 TRINITY_DN6804_c1_g1_i3:360-740(+)
MDSSVGQLAACEKLSLSTNNIKSIGPLNGLSNLRILSLGRNVIKKLENLDAVSGTLEELWISYNQIERLNGITSLKKLKVLYMSNNLVDKWSEFDRLVRFLFPPFSILPSPPSSLSQPFITLTNPS